MKNVATLREIVDILLHIIDEETPSPQIYAADDLPDDDFDLFLSDELGIDILAEMDYAMDDVDDARDEYAHSCPHGSSCDIHG